ncbi:MAG: T9SS type A sorting domain-containing protein [Prolixibacteraceae bacterium]|jgi:rhamnogalacturonan endolyase|nr:T9SS type A sorting domain-containing protein [Prolixibacteraceae bacterium]
MKKLIFITTAITLFCIFNQQLFAQKQVERLDRGAIAVKKGDGYLVSWRLLSDEDFDTGFNIYRNTSKINDTPVTVTTSYYDENAPQNSRYYIKAIIDGTEQENKKMARLINNIEGSNAGYFDIPLNRPAKGQHDGNYYPNDASTGDLNGDGEYDIVLKWDPDNSKDNSQGGTTDNVILDGYTLDGEHLWRIDLGPNIRAGAHYTQFLVFDFDGNGKAEIMCKTAPGTKDATGNYIDKGPAATTDHSTEYRNPWGYILSGPEYLTVFDGETGEELATANYWPLRGSVSSWGDDYGNRLDRYNAAVAYVDGERPSGVFQRGYYTRLTMAAWNWRNGELKREWTFDSNTPGNGTYYGQGNHSIHVIDADGDGRHDLVTGSSVISGTGAGIHTSRMGHGDATHVTYMKKDDPRPMIYMPHESGGHGVSLRYADNGEILFQHKKSGDVGRGCAAELDPQVPGFHFWASSGLGLYNLEGNYAGSIPNSINFVIWWDGDLSRELMNSNRIDKWSIKGNRSTRLFTGNNTSSNNGSKSTPTLQADLFGDWREEVILRHDNNQYLRVFTTTMETEHRLYTLMHDPVYRAAISWQNSSYNQPPHPGYYIASNMDFPVAKPNVEMLSGYYRGTGEIIKNLMVNDLHNASDWKVQFNLDADNSVYSNKTVYASEIPANLNGREWISTPTVSNEWSKGDTMATFEVTENAIISVLYSASAQTPEWLSSFERKDETISVSGMTTLPHDLVLYEKEFYVGDVVALGSNTADGDTDYQMYFVVARKMSNTSSLISFANRQFLKIYPNPASTHTTVQYKLHKREDVSAQLYDFTGKMVNRIDKKSTPAGLNFININTSAYPSGIYLLVVKINGESISEKIIIRNNESN